MHRHCDGLSDTEVLKRADGNRIGKEEIDAGARTVIRGKSSGLNCLAVHCPLDKGQVMQ